PPCNTAGRVHRSARTIISATTRSLAAWVNSMPSTSAKGSISDLMRASISIASVSSRAAACGIVLARQTTHARQHRGPSVTNTLFPAGRPPRVRPTAGKSAWRRAALRPADYRIDLSPGCLDEIRRAVEEIRAYPLPTILRRPDEFDMPHCRHAMARAKQVLKTGVRFALIQYLPLAEMSEDEAKAIYWLLASMVARPVAQKLDGRMIYDVHDTGQQALPGSGVRPDQTNIELKIHNDNAYNSVPPEYVGLLCLRPAKSGGHSRVVSFHTAHNELLARHPNVLPRLYRPFLFDRQKEFHPGEEATLPAPVFETSERDGATELRSRF